jgi:hemerythrin-like metal-binding protein
MPPNLRDPQAPEPAGDSSMTWSDARVLGFKAMDDVHKEFYDVTRQLLVCGPSGADAALAAFIAHANAHFGQEDEWMRTTEFPARDCHIDEHKAVLKSAHEVRDALAQGRAGVSLLRDFALHLFEWFPGHADYLDSALAAWMNKRLHGGKPVVLRRKVQD